MPSQYVAEDRRAISPWARADLPDDIDALPRVRVSDCTLRDGEQQPDVVFSPDQKVAIARLLAELGVDDIELGTPAVSREDVEAIERVASLDLGVMTSALARATRQDVDLVKSCGADAVRLSFPISERQRAAKTRVDASDYVKRAVEICGYAKGVGLDVIFSPYDTTRCDLPLLESLLEAFSAERCADRVRVVDTAGAATPEAIRYLVKFMREVDDQLEVEVHCHNDFGLATANTVAGALSGAQWISTTVNGLGERGGNASLEESVTALAVLYHLPTRIDLRALTALSRTVEELSAIPLQPHKAVVGRNAFSHEAGMVVGGVVRDPFTAEPYVPSLVGGERRIVLGKLSGRESIVHKLSELMPAVDQADFDVGRALNEVKAESMRLQRSLDDEETVQLFQRIHHAAKE